MIFVRLSLSRTEMAAYAFGFVGYLIALVVAAILFTFVYYNYFDRELTTDIIASYDQLVR